MSEWWVWVIALVVVVALYLRSIAGRLDRLHVRVEAAAAGLDAQLVRRASAASLLAHSGLVDPATAVLLADAVDLAQSAAERPLPAREQPEGALSDALRAALDHEEVDELRSAPGGRLALEEVKAAADRVVLARRFHNDVVRATLRLRERRLVRWLRLAGTAPWPRYFEIDDAPPSALSDVS